MASLASLYPSSYGYKKTPRPREEPEAPAPASAPAARTPRPSSSTTPDSTRQQIIATNNQRRSEGEQRQESGYRQADRRMAAIKQSQLEQSAQTPRSVDMANLMAANTPAPKAGTPQPRARVAVPIVTPAPQAAGAAGAPGAPGTPMIPPRLAQAAANIGMTPESHQAHTPQPIPLSPAGQTAQTIIAGEGGVQGGYNTLETARLAGSSNPVVSGAMQDAASIYNRMGQVAQGGGTPEAQRQQQVAQANAAMTPRPLAPPPTDYTPRYSAPVVPGNGSLDQRLAAQASTPGASPRMKTLAGQVQAGQQAIDTGSSLEQVRADEELAAARQQEVNVAAASNPPRTATTGTATQPKPALPPEKAAKVSALVSELRKANLPEGRAAQIQKEIDDVLSGIPKRGMMDIIRDMLGSGESGQTAQASPGASTATAVGRTADGKIRLSDGRDVSVEEARQLGAIQ